MSMDEYSYMTADTGNYGLLKSFASENRKNPTEAESVLWQIARSNALGVRFKRQHIIGTYIVDMVCLEKKLVIEIDGLYHQRPEQILSDEDRTEFLKRLGFRVIRFTNDEIICDTQNVASIIKQEINK